MKLPTVRPAAHIETPPLDITVIQTVDDRLQTYALQEIALGLNKGSRNSYMFAIWMWIGAALVTAALWYDDIREMGLEAFLSGAALFSIVPGAIILAVITVIYALWSRAAPRRRQAQYRRHIRETDTETPRTVYFRFDGEGITTAEKDDMMQMQPWHDNLKLIEDDRWFCYTNKLNELGIVIPKKDLNAEEIAAIRRWDDLRRSAGPPAEPAVPVELAGREISRSVEFSSSKEDLTATLLAAASAKAWKVARRRSLAVFGIAIILLTPSLYILSWAIDPERLPLSIATPLFLEIITTQMWLPTLAVLTLVVIIELAHPLFARWGASYYAGQMLEAGVGTSTVVIGENGLWDDGTATRLFIPWNAVRSLKITPDHLLLTIRLGATIAYPKRFFPPEQIAGIEKLFAEKASGSGPKGVAA